MNCMKGPGEVVIACRVNQQAEVDLVRFPDGSWGITRDDALVGVWEPAEFDECFSVFSMQVGIDKHAGPTAVIIRSRHSAETPVN